MYVHHVSKYCSWQRRGRQSNNSAEIHYLSDEPGLNAGRPALIEDGGLFSPPIVFAAESYSRVAFGNIHQFGPRQKEGCEIASQLPTIRAGDAFFP